MKRFIPLALVMLWLVIASHISCVAPSSRHANGLASRPTTDAAGQSVTAVTPIFGNAPSASAIGLRIDFASLAVDTRMLSLGHFVVSDNKHDHDITSLFDIRVVSGNAVELRFIAGKGDFGSGNHAVVELLPGLPLSGGAKLGHRVVLCCGTDSPATAMLSHVDHPDIKGVLSSRMRVREEAPTWEQLVAKVRPDFTWSGPDEEADWGGPHMLWIEKDKDGLIIFRLERAFTMETKNRPARWVLVEATGQERDDAYWNNFSNVLLPARIPMGKEAQEGDGCFADNYTKQIASDDKGGAVFEIGWAPEGNCGNGNYTRQVVVYMWKDLGGTWRLLGQGPITSTERAGCNRHQGQSLGTNVSWAGKPLQPVLKIDESCWFSDAGTEDGDPWPDLVQHEDYVLSLGADGKTNPIRQVSVRPYLLAEKDDTFGKIVQRLSVWSICNDTVWRKRLLLLNPALPAGTVAPGTRVELPTYTEIVDLANASITASQPATKRN